MRERAERREKRIKEEKEDRIWKRGWGQGDA